MEQFKIIQPTKALMPYVKHYWILRSDDIDNKQRIIPTGNLELFFYRGCPLKLFDKIIPTTSLSGQRNSFADLTPTGVVDIIGVTTKEFIRIVRFHKALFMLQNNVDMNFTALAYECGYYDLSHMTNEFKLFSGYTPTQYVSICTPYSDYFST